MPTTIITQTTPLSTVNTDFSNAFPLATDWFATDGYSMLVVNASWNASGGTASFEVIIEGCVGGDLLGNGATRLEPDSFRVSDNGTPAFNGDALVVSAITSAGQLVAVYKDLPEFVRFTSGNLGAGAGPFIATAVAK